MTSRRKIGIVVQRYGNEVNGGAEAHARLVATQLAKKYDITVLTSRALDYHTWKPEYPAGESWVDNIRVLRFENDMRGPRKLQRYYGYQVRGSRFTQKLHRWLGYNRWWEGLFPDVVITEEDSMQWLEVQGPAMPDLLAYLKEHKSEYTAFIVFTALYYPGALGVLTVPDKSIFIPTIHDEVASYFPIYKKVMAAPAYILFNTKAEKEFSEKLYSIDHVKKEIVGVGIDLLKGKIPIQKNVPKELGVNQRYIIYVGRVDKAKGCDLLIKLFTRFIEQTGASLQLVLVGKKMMSIKEHPNIICTGFIDDSIKEQLMLQAEALVIPSFYESLSLVLLESFGCGVPVIANGQTQVLKDHIDASGGGWCFSDYISFRKVLQTVLEKEGVKEKGKAGFRYVQTHYSWERVLAHFDEAIENIESKTAVSRQKTFWINKSDQGLKENKG